MRITEKQILIMIRVLEGSLNISDRNDLNLFGYSKDVRLKLMNDIINQQSDEIVDVKNEAEDN